MYSSTQLFFNLVKDPLKFRLYLMKNLPAAWLSGLKVQNVNEASATVSVPYKWFTKNPFRSTYFACLSMAAEMSTGLLAMGNLYKKSPSISMLIVATEGTFHKKATGITLFTCNDGGNIKEAIKQATDTGLPQTFKAYTVGKTESGEIVAEFWFTWSFKIKGNKVDKSSLK